MPPETLGVLPADPSLWDRISGWVSENKAVVYTIAGVAVVVTTAGAVYYIRSSSVRSYLAHACVACPLPSDLPYGWIYPWSWIYS
jgi:hypothetical protein